MFSYNCCKIIKKIMSPVLLHVIAATGTGSLSIQCVFISFKGTNKQTNKKKTQLQFEIIKKRHSHYIKKTLVGVGKRTVLPQIVRIMKEEGRKYTLLMTPHSFCCLLEAIQVTCFYCCYRNTHK